jgi:immunoglobulin-binding protein 1
MAESPPKLRSIFLSAKAKEAALQQVDGLSTTNEENLQTTISMFEDCRRLIEMLAIFSPNETSEDIGTHTIE